MGVSPLPGGLAGHGRRVARTLRADNRRAPGVRNADAPAATPSLTGRRRARYCPARMQRVTNAALGRRGPSAALIGGPRPRLARPESRAGAR